MIGDWHPLRGGRGTALAVAGRRTAAAEPQRLTVWSDDRLVARVEAPVRSPGLPRFAGEQVLWGAGKLDLAGGSYAPLAGIDEAIVAGTDAPSEPSPLGGYRLATSAWSADGEALVLTVSWTGPPGPPAARALLLDGSGDRPQTLWQQSDVAPTAAWVGRDLVVVGTRRPGVFNRGGEPLAKLPQGIPAQRLDADADEALLLIVETSRLTVWSTASWTEEGRLDGTWLDGALTPDGQAVVAVDLEGTLHVARTKDGLEMVAVVSPPDPIRGLAVGRDRIVAAFADGEPLRTATLEPS
jgi:hypothetical protein